MREDIQDYIIEQELLNAPLKDIVDGIESHFSVKMTKQNVSKFYSRYLQRKAREVNEKQMVDECIEIYIRQKYMKQCFGLEPIKDITEYKIKKYIKENQMLVNYKLDTLKEEILKQYMEGTSLEEISESTAYNGVNTDIRVIVDIIDENIKESGIRKLYSEHLSNISDIKEC